MLNYLLDSNHASPLVTLHNPLRQRILAAHQAGHQFAICAPVLSEIWFGMCSLPRAVQNRAEWQNLRPRLMFYGVDEQDALEAAELRLSLQRTGWQLAAVDALIATIALRYGLILLTSDKDFRAVPNLKTDNWR